MSAENAWWSLTYLSGAPCNRVDLQGAKGRIGMNDATCIGEEVDTSDCGKEDNKRVILSGLWRVMDLILRDWNIRFKSGSIRFKSGKFWINEGKEVRKEPVSDDGSSWILEVALLELIKFHITQNNNFVGDWLEAPKSFCRIVISQENNLEGLHTKFVVQFFSYVDICCTTNCLKIRNFWFPMVEPLIGCGLTPWVCGCYNNLEYCN